MSPSTHDAVADVRNADVQIWVDGEYFSREDAKVSVFDSAFLVGDGIWEGMRLHHGEIAFLDRHLARLFDGLSAVSIDLGVDRAGVASLLHEVLAHNGMTDGAHLRLMVSRGRKKTPSQHPSNLVSGPTIVVIAEYKAADPDVAARGISLFTSSIRRPPPDTLDQRLNCHSKLHEVIALVQAVEAGADEALMLDVRGAVATCNATNFFIVSAGEVITSQGHSNLPGITREVVLEESRALGLPTHERDYYVDDVHGADEAFVTGTFGGLTPVHTVDGVRIGGGDVPGPVTRRLQAAHRTAVDRDVEARAASRP